MSGFESAVWVACPKCGCLAPHGFPHKTCPIQFVSDTVHVIPLADYTAQAKRIAELEAALAPNRRMMEKITVASWREVDRLFSEKVYLGLREPYPQSPLPGQYPHYSESLDEALAGAEKILETCWLTLIGPLCDTQPSKIWSARLTRHFVTGSVWGAANTPARAVVLACLRLKGVEVEVKEEKT